MDNLELIVFIQDNTTQEILQGSMAMFNTGIEDVMDENEIAVYPNPAADQVNIKSETTIESITVYNFAGQVVISETVNNTTYRVNTSNLNSGIYLFQIETQEGRIAKRVIIE